MQRRVDGNLNDDGKIKSSLNALDYMLGGKATICMASASFLIMNEQMRPDELSQI